MSPPHKSIDFTEIRRICDACGTASSTRDYLYVRVTNGGLNLCRQCLDEINAKNPALLKLQAALAGIPDPAAWREAVREVAAAAEAETHEYLGIVQAESILFTPESEPITARVRDAQRRIEVRKRLTQALARLAALEQPK